jgi:hypothetical protein
MTRQTNEPEDGSDKQCRDETENANQSAIIEDLRIHQASAQSGQSFHTAAASNPPQPSPSPIIADYHLERERFLQEEAQSAQDAVRDAVRQRELNTQQARAQLQYVANERSCTSDE